MDELLLAEESVEVLFVSAPLDLQELREQLGLPQAEEWRQLVEHQG